MRGLRIIACFALVCVLAMSAAVSFAAKKGTDSPVKKTYYTAVNIWYEKTDKILTTNFHKGQIIPINTEVTIIKYGHSGFSFKDKDNIEYTIVYVPKHSVLPVKEIFNRYFSEQPVSMAGFTGEERKNIEAGTIAVGMSKKAVLVAYGYPPGHQTSSLESNQWKYWKNRAINFFVYFNKDGKVARISNE